MFCPKCNFNNKSEARFCGDCGFALHTIAIEEKSTAKESSFWTKTRNPKKLYSIIAIILAGVVLVPSVILGIIGAGIKQQQTPSPLPPTCQDSKATNFGGALPCAYPTPSIPIPPPKITPSAPTTQLPLPNTTPAPAPLNSDSNLVNIISQWRPRIVYVECHWLDSNNQIVQADSASGLLMTPYSPAYVLTNAHVLVYDQNGSKYGASGCSVKSPGLNDAIVVPQQDLGANQQVDVGILWLKNISQDISTLSKSYMKICATGVTKAALGEQVIILGYPGIGSDSDITVTEGIISGYDGDYYITSAKIEHGNSGGAAILVKDDCYLGIPSYAVAGQIESLGRILDINVAVERMVNNLPK